MSDRPCIIVTGSSGLIGSALCQKLTDSYDVVAFDRAGPPHPPAGVDCIDIDLSSTTQVAEAMRKARERHGSHFAAVVHLAAYYDFSGEPSPLYDEVTVHGTGRLLHALDGCVVEQFVFSSTMLIHAPTTPGKPIDEAWPIAAGWDYPQSKVDTEMLLRDHGRFPVVLLRIAGVYDDWCHSIPIAHQIQRIHDRRLIARVFPGDVRHGQSFVHLDDTVDAIVRAIERRQHLPRYLPLLIGEPETTSYDDLQKLIADRLHGADTPWQTTEIPKAMAKAGAWMQDHLPLGEDPFIKPWMIDFADQHYELDIGRARKVLGWEPKRRLRETIATMIDHLRADPDRWYRENDLEPSTQRRLTMPAANLFARAAGNRVQAQPWLLALLAAGVYLAAVPQIQSGHRPSTISDAATGVFVLLLCAASLWTGRAWPRWVVTILGSWLILAPLVFWTPTIGGVASDLLLGTLLILVAGAWPTVRISDQGTEIPAGWSYNPSGWSQRWPIVALALIGFVGAAYLAAYQFHFIDHPWDPLFGDGTAIVLTSSISKAFPVSDAGLGAVSYLLDALSSVIGDRRRWRTMPWMVLLFGLMIIPTGLTSVVLIMLQPIGVGAWCSICLATAIVMLLMVSPAIDEVIATVQYLRRARRRGLPFWRVLWHGGDDVPTEPAPAVAPCAFWPWTLPLAAAIGGWLMFAPYVVGSSASAAASDHLAGALVVTVAIIAIAQVARPMRWLLPLIGAGLLAAPLLLAGATGMSLANDIACGLALIGLAIPRGRITSSFGSWNRCLR